MHRANESGGRFSGADRRLRLGAFACLLAGAVTACAAPNYREPVTEFSVAAQNAEAALVALDTHVSGAYFEVLQQQVADGERLVQADSGDCELTSERCRLVALTADGDRQLYPPDPLLGNMVVLMHAMTAYAEGLQAIVQAETAGEVATAVNATLGSVDNLAETIDELAETRAARSVAAYKTPVGKALNWLVGQYVARVKIDALRHATRQANPVISRASGIFEAAAEFAGDLARREPLAAFDEARKRYEESESAADLDALIVTATAYDRLLTAKPSSVYAGFRDSHQALTDHLAGRDQSIADVFASINQFAAQAEALVAIVNELAAVEAE